MKELKTIIDYFNANEFKAENDFRNWQPNKNEMLILKLELNPFKEKFLTLDKDFFDFSKIEKELLDTKTKDKNIIPAFISTTKKSVKIGGFLYRKDIPAIFGIVNENIIHPLEIVSILEISISKAFEMLKIAPLNLKVEKGDVNSFFKILRDNKDKFPLLNEVSEWQPDKDKMLILYTDGKIRDFKVGVTENLFFEKIKESAEKHKDFSTLSVESSVFNENSQEKTKIEIVFIVNKHNTKEGVTIISKNITPPHIASEITLRTLDAILKNQKNV
jgi:hypothetical protein